jgi:hypothetical protein
MGPIIAAIPIRPPKAVSRRRSSSDPLIELGFDRHRKGPIAIAAAIPPTAEVISELKNATGSTRRMLPVKSARVARGMQILWD